MQEVNLLPAELAYLFNLLDVQSAIGIDEGVFPQEAPARTELPQQGYQTLKQHGLVTERDESGDEAVNPELLAITAAVAEPQQAIITEIHEIKTRPPKRLVHYFADDAIIEQTFCGRSGYRFSSLHEVHEVFFRIVRAIRVPDANRIGEHVVTLKAARSAKIKQAIDEKNPRQALAEFKRLSVDETVAKAAILSMAQPKYCGTIRCVGLRGRAIEDANGLVFFIGEGGCWLIIRCHSLGDDVVLRTANHVEAWASLRGLFGDVSMQPRTQSGWITALELARGK